MRLLEIMVAVATATCIPATGAHAFAWNRTINNDVRGATLGVEKTYDPEDPLIVSGTLLENFAAHCCDAYNVPLWTGEGSYSVVIVHPVAEGYGFTGGHGDCLGAKSFSFEAGGSSFDGLFSFVLGGGGVSWLSGPGLQELGSWVELLFKNCAGANVALVSCGRGDVFTQLPGCPDSPPIYGEVASPDLDGSGLTTASDLAFFTTFLGKPVTPQSGWQADFNHVGFNVDSSDLAYFAGRMGKLCIQENQKSGITDYQMDAQNLLRDDVRAVMSQHGISVAQILAAWDSMGFSYDRAFAANILMEDKTIVLPPSWSDVKILYR